MKRLLVGLFCVLGLVAALGTSGCGGSGSSKDTSALTASCNAYCDAYGAKACTAPYTSAADCKTGECVDFSSASAACQNALKAWYDCRATEADICADTGCDSQAAAFGSACPVTSN